eukprot:gene319-33542_t
MRKFFMDIPASGLSVKTVGLHATTSALMASCHRLYLPQDTDSFFLEYSINDAEQSRFSWTLPPLLRAPLNSLATDHIPPIPAHRMIPGNFECKMDTCIVEDALKTAARVGSSGFEWTDEGTGKWGWVATQPGAKLLIHVEAAADGEKAEVGVNIGYLRSFEHMGMAQVGVNIGYLRSFEHMGMAQVEGLSGCQCTTSVLDGNTTETSSLLQLHNIIVSKSTACTLAITVLGTTNALSREHKFKFGGVMVSEDREGATDPLFWVDHQVELPFQMSIKNTFRQNHRVHVLGFPSTKP